MTEQHLHGTAISLASKAAVFTGPSGCGKSSMALQLMALGAGLISDDRCILRRERDQIWVHRPPELPALIEARGVGLLPARLSNPAPLALLIDLGDDENQRLPSEKTVTFLGQKVTVFGKCHGAHFPAAIFHYLKHTP